MPSCNAVADSDIYQGDDEFKAGQRRCVRRWPTASSSAGVTAARGTSALPSTRTSARYAEGKMTSKEAARPYRTAASATG